MEWARYNTELININLIVKLSNKKGALQKSCLVHQTGDSVYADKDYDENGQEKGA